MEDSLWDGMSEYSEEEDPSDAIREQLDNLFVNVNELLGTLDNGGFEIQYEEVIEKLGKSEIRLKDTYIDRLDGNQTKQADDFHIYSHTFTFQESVQQLSNRNSVDIRVLMIPEKKGGGHLFATAEETCICNYDWFGCIAVFSIRHLGNWSSTFFPIFAHEIGHALGMDVHDDNFYDSNPGNKLIMWHAIGGEAFIWSPEAKRRINNHDN